MLTDEEIASISQAYVRRQYGPVIPGVEPLWEHELVRQFDLQEPPGVYFTVRVSRKMEPQVRSRDSGDDGMLVGDGGFFIDRRTGAIRRFGSGEIFSASAALTGRQDALFGSTPVDSRKVVRYLLTHSAEEPRSQLGALGQSRTNKKWWQFWKG